MDIIWTKRNRKSKEDMDLLFGNNRFFLLTVLISIWSSRIKGEPYGAFFDNFSINVMLEKYCSICFY